MLRNKLFGGVSYGAFFAPADAPAGGGVPAGGAAGGGAAAAAPGGAAPAQAAASAASATPAATPAPSPAPTPAATGAARAAAATSKTLIPEISAEPVAAAAGAAKPGEEQVGTKPDEKKDGQPAEQTEEQKVAAAAKVAETLKSYDALKMPDGVDPAQPLVAEFKTVASELGLPVDQAQRLSDVVAPKLKEALEAPYNAWADMIETWVAEAQKDPEIGGAKFKENLGLAASAIKTLGGPEAGKISKALAFTGAGNNPDILRLLVRAGKLVSEGKPAPAGNAAPAKKPNAAELFYPTMQEGK